jgi:hypothetical protein
MTTVRSSRANRAAALVLAATFTVVFGTSVSAHRLDELLQATRIGVEPDRVHLEINLTPGIAVADDFIRDIDTNGDRVLSPAEQDAYAEGVLSRVALRVDNLPPLRLSLIGSSFPDVAAMRTGDVAINLQLEADMPPLAIGEHRLFFHNNSATANHVYLANALVPESDRIAVTKQERDAGQSELTIEFALRETQSSRTWMWMSVAAALALAAPLTRRRRLTGGVS